MGDFDFQQKHLHRDFLNHTVETKLRDFSSITADDFQPESIHYIFALNSLWYYFRTIPEDKISQFLDLLFSSLAPNGELFIDSDTAEYIENLLPTDRAMLPLEGSRLLYRVFKKTVL